MLPRCRRANRLLGGLSEDEYGQIANRLERVYLDMKAPMVNANEPIEIVDFPSRRSSPR